MYSVKIDNLQSGMKFDKPVYIDKTHLFVPKGIPIKEKDLDRLRKWKIEEVFTDGTIIEEKLKPSEKKTPSFGIFESPNQQKILKKYSKFEELLSQVFERIKQNEVVETEKIDRLVDGIFSLFKTYGHDSLQFVLYGNVESTLIQNALNCALLSIYVGNSLNMVHHKLMQLVTGALIHDVGMLRIPDKIINKKGKLDPEEKKKIETHPIYTYKIITREMRYPDDIGFIGLQHHERWDGKGYPKQMMGKQIILPARIVAVVDAFEAMVSVRPYRDSMIGYSAMRTILSDNGRRFDPEILKIFIKSIGIYPIGGIVLLNNSSICRVTENHSDAPLRPKLRVLIDKNGKEYGFKNAPILDLLDNTKLFIVKAVNPKVLAKKVKNE